ncbi:MAG: hypothetical protein ANABAC_1598 [Anaerolineae bacterium]|nr:MAG: hypothetical protein ANABAC_1598 [Anaerolineae bacterium]
MSSPRWAGEGGVGRVAGKYVRGRILVRCGQKSPRSTRRRANGSACNCPSPPPHPRQRPAAPPRTLQRAEPDQIPCSLQSET